MKEADDPAARKARAEKLRRQISNIKNDSDNSQNQNEDISSEDAVAGDSRASHPSVSPRDFINRRMRELDKQSK